MSSNYVRSNQEGSLPLNALVAILFTLGVFAILPILQFVESLTNSDTGTAVTTNTDTPPPPPLDDEPPPEPEKKVQDEIEMKEPPPPMTLDQMELALNPGSGNAAGDFSFANFDDGINALDDMQIFSLSDVDRKPSAQFMSRPSYPYDLQQQGVEGSATVIFVVTAEGKVTRARVEKATHRQFEDPALQCVMRSQWKPAKKDGKPVNVWVKLPIEFSL